jgi:altronate dehydratase large subunit
MTGLVGGGAQIVLFSTGRGNAIGAPVAPTVKVTGNPNTALAMAENIDLDVSGIIARGESIEANADRLWSEVHKIAQGKLTRCEVLHEEQLSVSRFGRSV